MVHITKLVSTTGVALALLAATIHVEAHPGHAHTRSLEEITQRRVFHDNTHRSLAACADAEASRHLNEDAATRRLAKIQALRAERQRERQLRSAAASEVLAKSHKSSLTGISADSVKSSTLFGTTNKCVLEPEVTQGPYYVSGELIRKDIREKQPGIDLYVELQFVDTTTCKVVPDYYVDFWHCNATGVYSGVVASGNGNSNDLSNINATHSRGLAATDSEGVVQFLTKFPGHYTGRTTHVHILGNHNGKVLTNNTYAGGSVSSVGQLFFDQDLLTTVAATASYKVNTQTVTLNSADNILTESAATGFDPVVNYVLLGSTVEDGIFSWISVGVDTSVAKSVSAAATMTANGGVANANTNGGGGPGGAPGGKGATTAPTTTTTNTTNNSTTPASGTAKSAAFTAASVVVAAVVAVAAMV